MFEGPVSLTVASSLVANGPKDYQWSSFNNNNIVSDGGAYLAHTMEKEICPKILDFILWFSCTFFVNEGRSVSVPHSCWPLLMYLNLYFLYFPLFP